MFVALIYRLNFVNSLYDNRTSKRHPLIMASLEKSSLSELLTKHFPDHGNWQGLSGGKITVVFLSQVLSNNDHRLSPVEQWVSERLHTLRYLVKDPKLEARDFNDERLGALADKYSQDAPWYDFESEYNQGLLLDFGQNGNWETGKLG